MIRVLAYLAIVALLAFGAVWLAERPGDVVITWQGHRLETSVMVLTAAAAALAAAAVLFWSTLRAIVRSPAALARWRAERRRERGYRALSQGLVAVGSGNAGAARRHAEEAARAAPGEPLTLLLAAQAAQLSGDRDSASRTFERMTGRDDTRLLGLHGLYIEARRRNDGAGARLYAEEAARHAAVPPWAGQAVLELCCGEGDWAGALERLERNMKAGLLDKSLWRRQRAVLLTAQAIAAEDLDRDRAKALAQEAVKLAPDLVPAAAMAGRMLGEAGDLRRASRVIEGAWTANPHPDLAAAYAHLRPGDSARERLARIRALAAKAPPGDLEAAVAVAHAAIDARELAVAREALASRLGEPTRRVAALMAMLEEMQGDEGRAREWMARAVNARRDPAWTADGFVSDRWLPVSPVSGRLDAFSWKDPLAGEDHARPALEHAARPALTAPREPPPEGPAPTAARSPLVDVSPRKSEREPYSAPGPSASGSSPPASGASAEAPAPPAVDEPGAREREAVVRRPRLVTPVPIAPAVIPLVHAPDDPGPEPETPAEPSASSPPEPHGEGWSRIRKLLKP
jgi:HemY protein